MILETQPIPLRIDKYGVLRVGGTRLTVDLVIEAFNRGDSPQEIVDQFPVVTLADVYGVIAYYLAHKDQLDAYLSERETAAQELQRDIEEG